MKKSYRSLISFVMAVLMLTSVLAGSLGVQAAGTVDPKKIDKVIVDFRSEDAFSVNTQMYRHKVTAAEPDPDLGGVYTWDADKKALKLEYHEVGGNQYTVMTMMNEAKIITAEHKYMVVVYQAKTTAPYRMSVWNSPKKGFEAIITEKGADTAGKWMVSEPMDISGENNGGTLLSRFTVVSPNSLRIKTADKNAEFYIKEYGFFKSAEDAKAYYSVVDLEKSPAEYSNAGTSQSSSSAVNGLFSMNFITAEEPEAPAERPEADASKYPPIVVSFESKEAMSKNAALRYYEDGTGGTQEFVTLADGTGAMKITHNDRGTYKAGTYRFMPYLTAPYSLTVNRPYMRITYMTEEMIPSSVSIHNNAKSGGVTLVENTAVSKGSFVRSNAIDITPYEIQNRLNIGTHVTVQFNTPSAESALYVKEIAFFATKEQAYSYYGDSEVAEGVVYTAMTFGEGGTASVNSDGDNYGNCTVNADERVLDIAYAASTNKPNVKYMAKIKFNAKEDASIEHRFVRVLYSADNPDGVADASMFLMNDKIGTEIIRLAEKVNDTNGKYVLSEPVYMPLDMMSRFTAGNGYSIPIHNSLVFNTSAHGGAYSIKAVYFFPTRKAAESFTYTGDTHEITINGNDISKYQIVVADGAPENVMKAARDIALNIKTLSGVSVPVVTDDVPVSEYEILIGVSNRPLSRNRYDELAAKDSLYYWAGVDGNTLVISSVVGITTVTAAERANAAYFYNGLTNIPKLIDIRPGADIAAVDNSYARIDFWENGDDIDAPAVFTEDFDTDEGYFNEDNGETNWKYRNGAYTANASGFAASYVHVYEKNVDYSAKLSYTSANGGSMGIMARVNSEAAYVRAGYDFALGEWYIESRDGGDFYLERNASKKASVAPGTVYELALKLSGDEASLYINGAPVIIGAKVSHVSPGRLGVYAEGASVKVDDVSVILRSAQGTIIKNVLHTKFFTDTYLEGGSVFEMNDKSWLYTHQSGTTYKSLDHGKTWTKTDKWTDTYGYVNILRLNNGDFMKMAKIGGNVISQTSSDEGGTWVDGGILCPTAYNGSTAAAGNMNDKLTQTASGRIFYSQNFESAQIKVDGRNVFCQYFWSDDNGKTWTKSDTDSWEIPGNEDAVYFGENKLLECADGTIRMYASWHPYGNIVYSESKDGGKTFGPLMTMENMYCPQSSMQFVRDVYADNDYTYYMVWVNAKQETNNKHTPRSRLSLAKSTDGKEWVYLGDIWRWESTYNVGGPNGTLINHIVDPFIKVTEDYIVCGSGFSDSRKVEGEGGASAHQGQRQHIFSIRKDTLPEGKPMNVFTDVTYASPYYEAVTFVSDKGLFNGTSETEFSPSMAMTRSMFVTVLGRLDGADVTKHTVPTFKDVAAGQWYTPYVEWAAANSIVNGIGNGLYGINGNVTVEQVCVMLSRYADGKTSNASGKTLSDFSDSASVSAWAADGVKWAVENGVYSGIGGRLAPAANASRGLVASMFYNYVTVFGK